MRYEKRVDGRKTTNKEERRRKKKRVNKIKILLVIIILVLTGFYIYKNVTKTENTVQKQNVQGSNPKYNQETKKGYIDIYKTKQGKEYKNYVQGALAPWASFPYWDKDMESSGCGITCIATIASGYGNTKTPEDLRKKYYPSLKGDSIVDALQKDFKIKSTAFVYSMTEKEVMDHLKQDKPILICVINTPDDKWTTSSHYMVLLGAENKNVYVSNPSAGDFVHKDSGWYPISELMPYIVKAVFITQ